MSTSPVVTSLETLQPSGYSKCKNGMLGRGATCGLICLIIVFIIAVIIIYFLKPNWAMIKDGSGNIIGYNWPFIIIASLIIAIVIAILVMLFTQK